MRTSPDRLFAGHRLREIRKRLNLSQAEMGRLLGVSVSYLSQIENGDRPVTAAVVLALANAFPLEWTEVIPDDEAAMLVGAVEAGSDPTVPDHAMPEDLLRRAARQQPLLARRLMAIHAAYRQAQSQLAALDDTIAIGLSTGGMAPMPWEEVRDWFHDAGNYVDPLDRTAEVLHDALDPAEPIAVAMERRLVHVHGIRLDHAAAGDAGAPLAAFDPVRRSLSIDRSLPPESIAFFLAHQLARLEMGETMHRIARDANLAASESAALLSIGLANYAAGALLMPYAAYRQAARETRHDIDRLRRRFGVSFEQACHRLSTLQRPGLQGIPFFFCRVDMAGNITKRHSATRLQFARFGGACPLWIVHEAVAIPDRILVQLAELPEGSRYVSMAKGLVKATSSYLRPARRYAVALGCEIRHAGDFIYADQLELRGKGSATPIGISCRICPRTQCDQRAFPPAGRALEVDPDRRMTVPYTFE